MPPVVKTGKSIARTAIRARRLSQMDATFLLGETRETPMHIASLQIYQLPGNASKGFIKSVVEGLRAPPTVRPWNLKLAPTLLSRMAPAVIETDDIDMTYHVRHTCLPSPGGERELGELVSHLHSTLLDRSRPLWTCHVIEGLESRRFALYIKIHHALMDGVTSMGALTRWLGSKASTSDWSPPWAESSDARNSSSEKKSPRKKNASDNMSLIDWSRALTKAYSPLAKRRGSQVPVRFPFEAPHSVLNGPVTAARRVATQRLPLDRIKAIGKQSGASVNDVFLAICATALRRHLQDSGNLPKKSLIAGVPVSLRTDGADTDAGNAVGFMWSLMGTEIADPLKRLEAIRESTHASKSHMQSLPPKARAVFSSLNLLPAIIVLAAGQADRVRPPMNLIISNVPGPQQDLFLGRAKLEAMYPVSIPGQGMALNITCVSYAGQLAIGFTGSRDSLPHLQHLAVYAVDALEELERALSL